MKKLDVNDYGFAQLTLILLLHYLVKCRSRSLAVYNNKFMLGSACSMSVLLITVFTPSASHCRSTVQKHLAQTCGSVTLADSQTFYQMSVFNSNTHHLQMCKDDAILTSSVVINI